MDELPDIVSSGPDPGSGPRRPAGIAIAVILLACLAVIAVLATTVVHRDSTINSLHQALQRAQQAAQQTPRPATSSPVQLSGAGSAVFALPNVGLGSYSIGVAAVRIEPSSAELLWIFVYGQHAQPGQRYGLLQGRCGGQFVTPGDLAEATADQNGDLHIAVADPGVSPSESDISFLLYRLSDGVPLGGVRGPLIGGGAQTFVSKPSCPSLVSGPRVEERSPAQPPQEDAVMFRRSALVSVSAVAAGLLAVAGCKAQLTAGAPAQATAAAAAQSGPVKAGQLIIEPGAGFSPVYSLINGAKHSIDITMYEFADTTAEKDLAAAAKRGVTVEVILDQAEKDENSKAYSYFRSHGVAAAWSSSRFQYTHQKTMVVDGSEAVIMTANLTSEYYPTSRDFLVTDTNRSDISAITAVFAADFTHRSIHPSDGSDLVWSPTDSEDKMLALINGAHSSLRIYSEEMGDTTIEKALIKAAKRGVDVQVCGENSDGEYDSAYAKLADAGIHISYYSSSTGFYIHGKVIEADYGKPGARIFIGSENFSNTSLNDNRELGLIISNQTVMSAIATTFTADFKNGKQWK
jgi:cardiolipin synthase A/B